MRTLEEHRAAVLALVSPLPATPVPVAAALGLVLAQDVTALVDLPGFDNSAMDGYAVRASELAGASRENPGRPARQRRHRRRRHDPPRPRGRPHDADHDRCAAARGL
jgi:molybdopterin molybdotransferase